MDWKKEIKLSDLFGRAAKSPAEEGSPAETTDSVPFWKKEISLRRKPSAKPPADEGSPAGTPDSVPFWKKEISFGRKRKSAPPPPDSATLEPVADEEWVREQLAAAAAAAAGAAEAPTEPSGPPVGPPAPAPGIHPPVPAAELPPKPKENQAKQSLLKKEISFRRKPKATKGPKAPKQPKAERVRKARPARGIHKPGKRLVGLKIGASQLAAARIANNGQAELLQVAREPLEPGVVVGGELRDPESLAIALKAFFRKHKLPKRGVRLGIANNRIGVRTLDVVGISDSKQLANAIRFRAQEALPIPVEEAVLDYRILSESETAEGERVCRVLLVVAYRELVDRYVAACRKAGIGVVGIDLEAFALLRSLEAPRAVDSEPADAALVAVAIGHDRSTFAVSDRRVCEFTRVLEWGGSALDTAVARALDLSPSEAEPIKRSLSLAGGPAPEGLTEEQATAARDAMRRQVQTFARELVSSLQFYQNQPASLGIGEIVLTGGTAHLDGLAEDLQRLIGVRVRVGDPLGRVKVGRRLRTPEPIGSLAVAIGLGIED
jgi:type IV pilus assembly protein PilM